MIFLLFVICTAEASTFPVKKCSHPIFCTGNVLREIQMAGLFNDSKTFVDMKLKNSEEEILQSFETLMTRTRSKPSKEHMREFVKENFVQESEFEEWTPSDFTATPSFLSKIEDKEVQKFAQDLVNVWPKLARKIKREVFESRERYSIIPVKNGFIIPGGRFREFYYWDSYWIVRGLLLCEMTTTVRGMLDNFISTVNMYGHLPNGARIYYVYRSQPPLLTLMAYNYFRLTKDTAWLRKAVGTLDKELRFWINNRLVSLRKDGKIYRLARYISTIKEPRPESYAEDVHTAASFIYKQDKEKMWCDLRAAAESGWDFSSRWIVNKNGGNIGNLSSLRTHRIIPVDLNAFLCQAFRKMAEFYTQLNNPYKASYWFGKSRTFQKNIAEVLYNEEDGIWYDWDLVLSQPRKYFYPSNFAPLWAEAYHPHAAEMLGRRAVDYLGTNKIVSFEGGIPASLVQSGEQWDYPNAWPPLLDIVILGLYKTGNCEAKIVAKVLAEKWVRANMKGFQESGSMYEKYHAEKPGMYGSGGEYQVQSGFGWTNGVIFDFVNGFFTKRPRTDRIGAGHDFIFW